ncbi:MAG TPA: hypothetical protein VGB51_09205 [Actinomycetota bacterium]
MPRALGALLLLWLALLGSPSSAAPGTVRWLTIVRGDEGAFEGSLSSVRSDGRGERLLLDGGVASVDIAPDGTVYAVRRSLDESELVRLPVKGGAPEVVPAGPEGTFLSSVAVSPDGVPVVGRSVPSQLEVPEHLADSLRPLRRTQIPVLAPPDRPPGTTGTVTDATRRSYQLLFTNDPEGRLSHAEQVNRFVGGSTHAVPPPAGSTPVSVRGTEGSFSCGASSCFLDWQEGDVFYSVGEFGSSEEAVAFAEPLVTFDELLGFGWRFGDDLLEPQLVALEEGGERVLQAVDGYCECGYRPVDWGPDGVLVVFSVEGSTTLEEYPASGEDPRTVRDEAEGTVLDAAYAPGGIITLLGGEGGPPGTLVDPEGATIAEEVRSFDVSGSVLAYVDADGTVLVGDLESDEGPREVSAGAFEVSIAPRPIAARPTPSPTIIDEPPADEGSPVSLVILIGSGAAVLLGAALLVRWAARRRR